MWSKENDENKSILKTDANKTFYSCSYGYFWARRKPKFAKLIIIKLFVLDQIIGTMTDPTPSETYWKLGIKYGILIKLPQ